MIYLLVTSRLTGCHPRHGEKDGRSPKNEVPLLKVYISMFKPSSIHLPIDRSIHALMYAAIHSSIQPYKHTYVYFPYYSFVSRNRVSQVMQDAQKIRKMGKITLTAYEKTLPLEYVMDRRKGVRCMSI